MHTGTNAEGETSPRLAPLSETVLTGQWESGTEEDTEPQPDPIAVEWRGQTFVWNDLPYSDQRDYIAWRREQDDQIAVNAVLDALADYLYTSGVELRRERGQEEPPPQTPTLSPFVVFERPPGAKPSKKPRRKAKS